MPIPPFRDRVLPLVTIGLTAPIFAELSSGYLDSTGDPVAMMQQMIVFVPLYGVALCIHELAVRTGGRWLAVVAFGLAFGVLQAGITDHSIFTLTGTDVSYWQSIVEPTWVAGFTAGGAFGWVAGHLIISILAPLVITEALFPAVRGQRLLGRVGIVVWPALFVLASIVVYVELSGTYRPGPSAAAVFVVIGLILALVLIGSSRLGKLGRLIPGPVPARELIIPFALGAVIMVAVDSASTSWLVLAFAVIISGAATTAFLVYAGRRGQKLGHLLALILGTLIARGIEAFQTPTEAGVTSVQMLGHNLGFLILVALLGVLALRPLRTTARAEPV